MSDQIDTGYAEPPEQWIVAHQVQPTRCPSCGTVHAAAPYAPTPMTAAGGGAHPHAARPGAMASVAESHGELVDRCHRAEARCEILRSELTAAREQLAAVPWEALRTARHIASWHLWPPTRAAAEWFDASAPQEGGLP